MVRSLGSTQAPVLSLCLCGNGWGSGGGVFYRKMWRHLDSGQKRTRKHILVFGEIFVQIALKDVDIEREKERRGEEKWKIESKQIIGLD
jgi:hypothetical protein